MPIDGPTPIVITRRQRNVLVGVIVLAIVLVSWFAPTVPKLVLAGGALALILSFPVRVLSRPLPRGLAIVLVMALLAVGLSLAVLILIPIAISQLAALVEDVPGLIAEADDLLRRVVTAVVARGLIDPATQPQQIIDQIQAEAVARAQRIGEQALGTALDVVSGTFTLILTLFGVLFVTVYLLADTDRFRRGFVRAMPLVYRDDADALWREVGEALSNYLGGLLITIAFQGVTSTIVLFLLGVPYSLLLGIWTMIGAIVPYVGSYIGGVPAVIAALFVSPLTAILTAVAYFAINQIDGNLIAPRVQGHAIRVHPLLIFLAVIVGGEVFGLWGALMAVPALAVLRAVIDFLAIRLVVAEDQPRAVGAAPAPALTAATIATPPDAAPATPAAVVADHQL